MANDFSGDSNCVALWRFESGALTTDSCTWNSARNTLTDLHTVTENTTAYAEGACSADFERSNEEAFYIDDANLCTGYPLKNGDTNKKISVCQWFRIEGLYATSTQSNYLYYKGAVNKASWGLRIYNNAGSYELQMRIGYNSGDSSEYIVVNARSWNTDVWYHIGATFQDSDKAWLVRLFETGVGATTYSGTSTNNVNVEDGQVVIGSSTNSSGYTFWDGEIDEIVVFNDILTEAEIDKIRAGTYGATTGILQMVRYGMGEMDSLGEKHG